MQEFFIPLVRQTIRGPIIGDFYKIMRETESIAWAVRVRSSPNHQLRARSLTPRATDQVLRRLPWHPYVKQGVTSGAQFRVASIWKFEKEKTFENC